MQDGLHCCCQFPPLFLLSFMSRDKAPRPTHKKQQTKPNNKIKQTSQQRSSEKKEAVNGFESYLKKKKYEEACRAVIWDRFPVLLFLCLRARAFPIRAPVRTASTAFGTF